MAPVAGVSAATPGRVLLRWWFLKAATPTCAACAQRLREQRAPLAATGVDVVGLSLDAQPILDEWAAVLRLPFPLRSMTPEQAAAMGARRAEGDPWRDVLAARVATLVDERGAVLAHWQVTDPSAFAGEVAAHLAAARAVAV